MSINVREVERDQLWLMPPSVRDWLPEAHLAWFALDVVAELELAEFYAAHRADGRGGPVYDPALMLACSSTPTASVSARRGASSAAWSTTWRGAWWRPINAPITPPSPGSAPAIKMPSPSCSAR